MLLSLLIACQGPGPLTLGPWTVTPNDDGSLDVAGDHARWTHLRLRSGPGPTVGVQTQLGAFRFDPVTAALPQIEALTQPDPDLPELEATLSDGSTATVQLREDEGGLRLRWTEACDPREGCLTDRWLGLSADCEADEHFLGAGSHAMDVDHVGQAFPLWVSEPGIGKSTVEEPSDTWFLDGTRHASGYPVPFLLRPQQPSGMLLDTLARVEVDLCKADPATFSATVWGDGELLLLDGERPADVVRALSAETGRPPLPPRWAFGPWTDAIRGDARVRDVAQRLRAAGAPSTVIWSEDWKGANETGTGYRLSEEWDLDAALYPNVEDTDAWLEARGFKWFAYFAPFVGMEAASGDAASAAGALIQTPAGEDYVFTGVTFKPTSHIDVHSEAGRAWAKGKMEAVVAHGFDGWMADYGEWLPTDARVAGSAEPNGLQLHNDVPRRWQELQREVIDGRDMTVFCRSGWSNTSGACPIVWLGDQRTSFDADDGLPTVIPLALGLAWSGVPIITHDVAGYQSVGNPPSDREVWYRWAALGAFSPIFRTHHGSFDTQNWQFDEDEETLARFAALAVEHTRLWPYRYALAAEASRDGTPMVRPTAYELDGEPWDRMDAWLLGPSLLVAPVLEQGATSRDVALPGGVGWYDWWTRAPASSGEVDVPLDHIPVYARAGTTVPVFVSVPDTLLDGPLEDGITGFAEADAARELLLWGGGGPFTEADGTTYTPSGSPTGAASVTVTLTAGEIEAGGVTLRVEGSVERAYTVTVIP